MSELPLQLLGVCHRYGETPVLAGVDLSLSPGELVAMLGTSGSGKTTVLRSVAGLVTPAGGTIRIAGRDVVKDGVELVPVEARKVGLVFQEYALFPYLDVRRNVAFGVQGRAPERVQELLELMGLEAYATRRPGELSGGQQQRVALARALAPQPHLLLLDEPFANVDASRRRQIGEELVRILRTTQTAGLMVTHDQADAMAHADRLAVLVPGQGGARLAQLQTPEVVYAQPVSREVAQLVGPSIFVSGTADGVRVQTPLGVLELIEARSGEVEVLLRPEQVRFEPAQDGPDRVTARAFLGRGQRLTLDTAAGPVEAEVEAAGAPLVGARGHVRVVGPIWALPR